MSSQSQAPRRWRLSHFWRQVAIGLVVAYMVGATPLLPAIAQEAVRFVGGMLHPLGPPQEAMPQPSPASTHRDEGVITAGPGVTATASPDSGSQSPESGLATLAPESRCEPDPIVKWTDHEPNFEPTLTVSSEACDILMVSSQTIDIPGAGPCLADVRHVCVLVIMAGSTAHTFTVSGLRVSWWGTARTTIDGAIADKVNDQRRGWFSPANCSGGCDGAIVSVLDADGTLIDTRPISRP
jgi:hypothetical protein